MINFNKFYLSNGLLVIVHEEPNTPVAIVNLLYKVGARDEDENKTGFAHLFEHLMFGGSRHIPRCDEALQRVGGENNAFTSNDITNYYVMLPAANVETAFWLESDRMLGLAFSERALDVQRKVVIEEYKQNYLNRPYGDAWLAIHSLSYRTHPYRWATIGRDISHIEQATLSDVEQFFYTYYVPNNAVLVVSGNVKTEQVKRLCQKWFEPIPMGKPIARALPQEPEQQEKRVQHIEKNVPSNAIYKTYHMCGHFDPSFYAADLLSDVLSRGDASRLYQKLVQKDQLFTSISAHLMGSIDPGLFIVNGQINEGVSMEEAEQALTTMLNDVVQHAVGPEELDKAKNQYLSSHYFELLDALHRAINLAYSSLSGDINWMNATMDKVAALTPVDVQRQAKSILQERNSNTIYYHATKGAA